MLLLRSGSNGVAADRAPARTRGGPALRAAARVRGRGPCERGADAASVKRSETRRQVKLTMIMINFSSAPTRCSSPTR